MSTQTLEILDRIATSLEQIAAILGNETKIGGSFWHAAAPTEEDDRGRTS